MLSRIIALAKRVSFVIANRTEFIERAKSNPLMHSAHARKNQWRILLDLVLIHLRCGEFSTRYFSQRLDLKGRNALSEFLPYERFRQLRDRRNLPFSAAKPFHYACLLRDKVLFARYFGAADLPVPATEGLIQPGLASVFSSVGDGDLFSLMSKVGGERQFFCKPRYGIKGRGVFRLTITPMDIRVNGDALTREQMLTLIDCEYLCQEMIQQHEELRQFHPTSVNTLRIVTFRRINEIEVFACYLRMGCAGQLADNNGVARAIVGVSPVGGELADSGFAIRGEDPVIIRSHPDTEITFAGSIIPDITTCVELARRAHTWLPVMQSVGWDFALTPRGYILLEGNDDWGATTALWIKDDFVKAFLERVH